MFPFNSTQPVDFSLYKTGTVAPTPSTNSGQSAPSTTTPPVTAPSTFTTPSGAVVSASGSLISGPTTSAPQPVTLNADAINNPATLYQVPTAPTTPNYGATLASIPTIESIMAEKSPDQIAAESTQKSLQERILGVLGSLGGKGSAEATAEQQAGIPDIQKQLGDVNAQIRDFAGGSASDTAEGSRRRDGPRDNRSGTGAYRGVEASPQYHPSFGTLRDCGDAARKPRPRASAGGESKLRHNLIRCKRSSLLEASVRFQQREHEQGR
jgi:hypothetical protein